MKTALSRGLLYGALFVLYLLHNDLWFWNDARLVLGLPVGLLYHIGFCIAASFLMWGLVTNAWPRHLKFDKKEKERAR